MDLNYETLDSFRTLYCSTNSMSKDSLAMENFRAAVLGIASTDPTKPLTDARKSLIDKRIREFFAHLRYPDHPTYSAMIHRAIQELNEEGGSSEESISNFIRKEYNDLPWAHSTFLNHHLGKLCESGEIVLTLDNSYLLAGAIMKQKPSLGSKRKELKRKRSKKRGRKRSRPYKKEEIEEEYLPSSSLGSKRKELKRKRSKMQGRKQGRPYKKEEIEEEYQLKEPMEMIEGQNQLLEDRPKVVDKQSQAQNSEMSQSSDDGEKGEPMQVIEEQNQALEDRTKVVDKQSQAQNSEMLQSSDDGEKAMEVIEEQNQVLEDRTKVVDKQNQAQPMEVIEEQNQVLEDHTKVVDKQNQAQNSEMLQSSDDGEKGDGSKLEALPVESLGLIMEEEKKEFSEEEEQLMKSPGEESFDIVGLQPQQQLDLPVPEKSSKPKSIPELSCTQDQVELKRKELKRMRSKKQGRKRGRPSKKEEIEEECQLKEPMEVIEEQNQVLEDRTKVVDKQNQAQNSEMLQSSDDGEKSDGSKLEVLPVDIVGLQAQQQLDLPVPEKSSELKSIAELSCTQDQLEQQTQEKPQRRILRPRPPKAGSLTATNMTESLPSQHQHEEQQQPESQAQGLLPQPKPDMATVVEELLPSDKQHQQEVQQQPESQAQGLLPQPKPDMATVVEELLPSDKQHQQEVQQQPSQQGQGNAPKHQGRGRPKLQQEQLEQPECRGSGRPRQQQEQLEQPECRGRGRSKKQQEQPKCRGRGRPKLQQEQPKCRGRGRPPKPKPTGSIDMKTQ